MNSASVCLVAVKSRNQMAALREQHCHLAVTAFNRTQNKLMPHIFAGYLLIVNSIIDKIVKTQLPSMILWHRSVSHLSDMVILQTRMRRIEVLKSGLYVSSGFAKLRMEGLAALNICHPNLQNSQHQLNLRLFFMLDYNDLKMKIALFCHKQEWGNSNSL